MASAPKFPPKRWPPKDPDERLDYGFDWSPRALGTDTIETITATVVRGSVIVATSSVAQLENVPVGQGTRHWLTGGVLGEECEILLRAVTAASRSLDQTVLILIKER